jgi:hypothetical protein
MAVIVDIVSHLVIFKVQKRRGREGGREEGREQHKTVDSAQNISHVYC